MNKTEQRRRPISVYLDGDDAKWLHFHAFEVGKTKTAVIQEAFSNYRKQFEKEKEQKGN